MLHRMVEDSGTNDGHTVSYLRQCLEYLQENGHSFVSIEDIIKYLRGGKSLPPKPVAFTMDDGFADQTDLAAPVFIEFNCPVTIFVITGMLDNILWPWFCQVEYLIKNSKAETIELDLPTGKKLYDLGTLNINSRPVNTILEAIKDVSWETVPGILEKLSHSTQVDIPATPPGDYEPISWDKARDLENQGISFGPHTISHPILSRVSGGESEREITGSWQRLKDELSSPSRVFCYPNGRLTDFGAREVGIVQKNGLLGALSTVPSHATSASRANDSLYALPRFEVPDTIQDFIRYCTWIEYAKQKFL